MKKCLIFFAFLGGISTAHAAECRIIKQPNGSFSDSCAASDLVCDAPGQGIIATYPKIGEGCITEEEFKKKHALDYLIPKANNAGDNKKEEAKKEKSEDPCDETLTPNKPKTLKTIPDVLKNWNVSRERARLVPAGPTTDNFRAGAGIVAGEPKCVWIYQDLATRKYFECINSSNLPTRQRQEAFCADLKPKEILTAGKFACDNDKLSGNIFNAFWGFLTHRKPY